MIVPLRDGDIEAAVELSACAGWNQTEADWRMLLRLSPDGCLGIHVEGRLAATAALVAYGRRLGWIGMMLTSPAYRRRGFARRLLERVIEQADSLGIATLKLDATEQGQPLYEKLGFQPEQAIERWRRAGQTMGLDEPERGGRMAICAAGENACSTTQHQQPAAVVEQAFGLHSIDFEAFGADRSAVLRGLAGRSAMFVSDDAFAFCREGREAAYLGPSVALTREAALIAIEACVPSAAACFWDLLPANGAALDLAGELGFERQRRLSRMWRGAPLKAREERIWAIAGFELG